MSQPDFKRTAITGGIGSGKSHVCRMLEQRGLQVYDCDAAAKRLMRCDAVLRRQLISLVGPEVYDAAGILQKAVLAKFLLASEANKQAVNDVVHPAVARDFMQNGGQWLESAILFESGFYRRVPLDRVVCVTAPDDVRLARIMQRDGISREKAQEWMRCQMPQDEMARRSDFVISNDGTEELETQIDHLLNHQ